MIIARFFKFGPFGLLEFSEEEKQDVEAKMMFA
jgi:hypothetical protein